MNTKQFVARTIIIFVSLTLAGIAVAVSAQVIPDAFAQALMVASGCAIFGSGLTFFLLRFAMRFEK